MADFYAECQSNDQALPGTSHDVGAFASDVAQCRASLCSTTSSSRTTRRPFLDAVAKTFLSRRGKSPSSGDQQAKKGRPRNEARGPTRIFSVSRLGAVVGKAIRTSPLDEGTRQGRAGKLEPLPQIKPTIPFAYNAIWIA